MKKVGIVSLYYNNRNHGGLLQAYALTKFISDLGYDAEQLCWERACGIFCENKAKRSFKLHKIPHYIYTILSRKLMKFHRFRLKDKFSAREAAYKQFHDTIPHSDKVYNKNTIHEGLNDYGAIIVGSDQVWNMAWYDTEFFLNCIPDDIYKFSYAASMPDTDLSDEQKENLFSGVKSFNAISVREQKTAKFLSDLTEKNIYHTVDPTMLLSRADWDAVCSKRLIKEKYIFCYYLGADADIRKEAKRFAKKTGMKIAAFPYLCGNGLADLSFGDYRLFDVSPADFISLIKHAEYVLTDSFHAAVFSNIYSVKHFVFDRKKYKMNERIISLLDMFNSGERFFEADSDRMYQMKDIPICSSKKFEIIKKESVDFLMDNLKKAFSQQDIL